LLRSPHAAGEDRNYQQVILPLKVRLWRSPFAASEDRNTSSATAVINLYI
jgi:hypothetical protein